MVLTFLLRYVNATGHIGWGEVRKRRGMCKISMSPPGKESHKWDVFFPQRWFEMRFYTKRNSHTHRIHGTIVYIPTWMVDFYGFHVGKYTLQYTIHGSYGIDSPKDGRWPKWLGCPSISGPQPTSCDWQINSNMYRIYIYTVITV